MKKSLTLFAFATLLAAQSFATYIVVLKDGTRYNAKAKWTVVNGKALIALETGQTLQLDPALIDAAQSEKLTKMGITNANVIDLNPNMPEAQAPKQQPSLGSQIRLKKGNEPVPAPVTSPNSPAAAPLQTGGPQVPAEAIEKFTRAYENVGIFEQSVKAHGPRTLRAELTADSEDKVFNAISATSFLMVRNAGVAGAQIDMVELFMRTTNGGAAGRFQMSREDAEALDKRTISQQDYFIRKVIY